MFLPDNLRNTKAEDAAEVAKKAAFEQIEKWSMDIIPGHLREDVMFSVQEVSCSDPECSPIDTAIAIIFSK